MNRVNQGAPGRGRGRSACVGRYLDLFAAGGLVGVVRGVPPAFGMLEFRVLRGCVCTYRESYLRMAISSFMR